MVHDDDPGVRTAQIYGTDFPHSTTSIPDATQDCILRVANEHPDWLPLRVHREIHMTRHDITIQQVENVLNDPTLRHDYLR